MKQTIVLLVGLAVFAGGCATTETAEKTVWIEVAADGSLTLAGEHIILAGLEQALEKHNVQKKAQVIVAADKGTEIRHVAAVLGERDKLGHTNVAMVSR